MQKSKLIQILKTFSKQEMKDFEKFISSPYFSPGRNLKPLFNVLKKYHPSFASDSFTTEKVFRKLYPGKKYEKKKSEHALQVLVSEMRSLAEKFLALEFLQKDNDGYEVYSALSYVLIEKNLTNYAVKLTLKSIECIHKTESSGYFFNQMLLLNSQLETIYLLLGKESEVSRYSQRFPLYLFGSMFWELARSVNDYIILGRRYKINLKNIKLLEKFVNAFDTEIFENECYDDGVGTKQQILTNYYLIKCQLNTNDEKSLIIAIQIYKKNFTKFNYSVKWFFMQRIINICSVRRSIDLPKYSFLGSNLIDFAINNGIVSYGKNWAIAPDLYLGYFHTKLCYSDSRGTLKIIEKLLQKVQSEHQKSMQEYSYAWLSFKDSDYERTLEYLSKLNTQFSPCKNNATKLRLASFFSLGHTEEALSGLNSFEQFARNNSKIAGEIDGRIKLFTKSMRTLIKYRTNSDQANENTLNKIIEDNKNTLFCFWFEREVDKLRIKT